MLQWVPYPFLRMTPVLIAGILTGYYTGLAFPLEGYGFLLLLYALLVVGTPPRYRFYISLPCGIIGLTLIFLLGGMLSNIKQENKNALHISQADSVYQYYTATVVESPQRRDKVFRTVVSVRQLVHTDSLGNIRQTRRSQGKVMLYQPEKDSLHLLQYGDQVLIKGQPELVQPPANPHAFDFRQHLAQKNIYHQQYLPAENLTVYAHQTAWSLVAFANSLRQESQAILLQNIPGREASGIALALTLGVKDYLSSEISQSYAATGAMHVLAVSGLHVGIIYLLLSWLLKPLLRIPNIGHGLRAGICIAVLWLYALVAGWSPSVLRAATMFTFIIVAQATRRQTNIYNTLAASAFFLLCYDPLLVMTVGFQLSYLAVTGIVYLQPKIYRWFDFPYWLPDKIWSLTAVSIAAQVATFPVSLYYFHQFPVYFWLSNLLVIPAAFIILCLGLLTIAVGFAFPAAAYLPGWLLGHIIGWVNQGVVAIQQLPYSTWQDITLSLPQMLLLYGLTACILLLMHKRQFRYTIYAFICVLAFAGLRFYQFYRQNEQNSLTFYSIDGQRNVDFTTGLQNVHVGEYNDQAKFHVSPNHIQAGLLTSFVHDTLSSNALALQKAGNLKLCVWHGQKIIFVEEPFGRTTLPEQKIKADLVVISHNSVKRLETLCALFDFSLLVIDSSNSPYRSQKLADEAEKLRVPYHAVSQQGALTLHIPD